MFLPWVCTRNTRLKVDVCVVFWLDKTAALFAEPVIRAFIQQSHT